MEFEPECLLRHPATPFKMGFDMEDQQQPTSDSGAQLVLTTDRPKIRKPPGEVARPKRKGYKLIDELQWEEDVYPRVQVC